MYELSLSLSLSCALVHQFYSIANSINYRLVEYTIMYHAMTISSIRWRSSYMCPEC